MFLGLPGSNGPPETSQGLRPGTPLHVFKKARHLPQSMSPQQAVRDAVRAHVPRPRRDPNAPPLTPPSRTLRASLVLAGVAWLGAAVADALLGSRLLALAEIAVAYLALRWNFESPRHSGWWILVASALVAGARIASLIAIPVASL